MKTLTRLLVLLLWLPMLAVAGITIPFNQANVSITGGSFGPFSISTDGLRIYPKGGTDLGPGSFQLQVNGGIYAGGGAASYFSAISANNMYITGPTVLSGGTLYIAGTTFNNPAVLTVGASPWTYTNSHNYAVIVNVTGGTVSAQAFVRNSITVNENAGVAHTELKPGDALTITYSVAPTVTEIPW